MTDCAAIWSRRRRSGPRANRCSTTARPRSCRASREPRTSLPGERLVPRALRRTGRPETRDSSRFESRCRLGHRARCPRRASSSTPPRPRRQRPRDPPVHRRRRGGRTPPIRLLFGDSARPRASRRREALSDCEESSLRKRSQPAVRRQEDRVHVISVSVSGEPSSSIHRDESRFRANTSSNLRVSGSKWPPHKNRAGTQVARRACRRRNALRMKSLRSGSSDMTALTCSGGTRSTRPFEVVGERDGGRSDR